MTRLKIVSRVACALAALLALGDLGLAVSAASAVPTFDDPFNQAGLGAGSGSPNDGGNLSIDSGRQSGVAEVSQARISSSTTAPGRAEGFARADHGSLKAFLRYEGSMADGGASARTNEGFTITDPNVAPGTAGLMQLVFFLSGDATVHDANGNGVPGDGPPGEFFPFVVANLVVFKDPTAGSNGTEEARLQVSVPNGGAVVPGTGPGRFIANVNFDYGTPFNVMTVLSLGVRSDGTFTFLPNGNLIRTGGIVEVVEGDFGNSVDLHQVFIPVGASLAADSDFNYGPLLRFGQAPDQEPGPTPVPLPATVYLMGSALLLLLGVSRK